MIKKGIVALILLLNVFYLCGCYYTFYDRMGRKYKAWNLVGDDSKQYLASENKIIKPFSLNDFNATIVNKENPPSFEYLIPSDISKIRQKYSKLFLIFWNPRCPGGADQIQLAERIDSLNIPVIIASLSYNLNMIKERLKNTAFHNRIIYVIPSENFYDKKMMIKQFSFIRDLCDSCYRKYQGDLTFCQGLVFNNSMDPPKVLFGLRYHDILNLLDLTN